MPEQDIDIRYHTIWEALRRASLISVTVLHMRWLQIYWQSCYYRICLNIVYD